MSKLGELIKSPQIQVALALGFSIIAMAYVSKRVLHEPIGALGLAMPPFVVLIHELVARRYKNSRICTTWYWVVGILIATALVIASHAF